MPIEALTYSEYCIRCKKEYDKSVYFCFCITCYQSLCPSCYNEHRCDEFKIVVPQIKKHPYLFSLENFMYVFK